jgi:hypothetical protein
MHSGFLCFDQSWVLLRIGLILLALGLHPFGGLAHLLAALLDALLQFTRLGRFRSRRR